MECWVFLHLSRNHPAIGVNVSTLSTLTTRPKNDVPPIQTKIQWNDRYSTFYDFYQPGVVTFFSMLYHGAVEYVGVVIMHSSCLRCRRLSTLSTLNTRSKNTVPLIQTRSKNTVPLNQTKNLWNDGYFTFYQFNLVSVDSLP